MTQPSGLRTLLAPALVVLLTIAGEHHAAAAALDWQAPVGCPARDVIERRLREAIGNPIESAADVHFTCRVTQSSRGTFRLELRVEAAKAKTNAAPRVFEAPGCDQVADTAVVAMALALGANLTESPRPKSDESSSSGEPTSSSNQDVSATDQAETPGKSAVTAPGASRQPTTPMAASRPGPSRFWAGARIGPQLAIGSLPKAAPGMQAAILLGYRSVSARLSGFVFPEQRITLADGSGGDFALLGAAISLCGHSVRERAYASICGGIELGRMNGSGAPSLRVARQGSSGWVTPRIDVELTTPPWLFGMRGFLGAAAGLPLVRSPFTFGRFELVHQADRIVWLLNAGLEINWP